MGLMAMILLRLLPTVASVQHSYWYARSSEFFVFGLGFGYSLADHGQPATGVRRRVRTDARRELTQPASGRR